MGIIASVAAFLSRKSGPPPRRELPEVYKSMSAAELKDAALAGDLQAEAALRQRAEAAGK
ncbi:hypothetical protein [Hyphomonas sp.]|jgi:hypothetical protein|uniref:hypothetical protein n=1 Tax=Hyphomonas sp. TaxID=87 RepID=UPI0032D96D8C